MTIQSKKEEVDLIKINWDIPKEILSETQKIILYLELKMEELEARIAELEAKAALEPEKM